MPTDDDDLERLVFSHSKKLQKLLAERREEVRFGETISLDEAFAHLKD